MLYCPSILLTFLAFFIAIASSDCVAQETTEDPSWAPERIRQAGLREVNSAHLRMITDLPPDPEIDELPEIFDQAIPQWFDGFAITPAPLPKEKLKLLLFRDRAKMEQMGLIDASLPPFPNGYQRGPIMYVAEPPSAYYRRHLVLHEGTHWFMETFLGGYGPPWIAEGLAERWATHRWDRKQLQMKTIPENRDEYPYWGRFRFIREQLAAGKAPSLESIMRFSERSAMEVEMYAWSWSAVCFFDSQPALQQSLTDALKENPRDGMGFNRRIFQNLRDRWPWVRMQWEGMLDRFDYGFDLQQDSPAILQNLPTPQTLPVTLKIAAGTGWQATGVRMEEGQRVTIRAVGRVQLGETTRSWWSEPQGVTLRYTRSNPLGSLIATVAPFHDTEPKQTMTWQHQRVGKQAELEATAGGELLLEINELPSGRKDNQGEYVVTIESID
ncbi:MAG: hypothetical protein ACK5ZC_18225 [Pirellulaceae bacterium]|jgi:hypothetical protein